MKSAQKYATAPPLSTQQQQGYYNYFSKQFDNISQAQQLCSQTQLYQEEVKQVNKKKIILKKNKKQWANYEDKCQFIKKKRINTIKKLKILENRICQLQQEVQSLRRICLSCPHCHLSNIETCTMFPIDQKQHLLRYIQNINNDNKAVRQSVQFEQIDFSQSLAYRSDLDDKTWIMVGMMMIIMGSRNADADGVTNTYKILGNCIDSIQRQIQKSQKKISLDIYCDRQQLKQDHQIQGIKINPFFQSKIYNGFQLSNLKIQTCQLFDLVYQRKYTICTNYQAIISAMEYLKQNCWICF